jgi:hypothetical protein
MRSRSKQNRCGHPDQQHKRGGGGSSQEDDKNHSAACKTMQRCLSSANNTLCSASNADSENRSKQTQQIIASWLHLLHARHLHRYFQPSWLSHGH